MGRRSLPKIDPSLDLSRHLIKSDDLPQTVSSQSLFQNDLLLQVEVGSGKGLFMASASAELPDHNFVGIEIAGKYARFAAAKLAKARRQNARMIHGDAEQVFAERIPAGSLAAVHVYFPDPWWKARHRKRRVMNESFLHRVEQTLVPGGELHFWTDVQEYFDVTLELIGQCTRLDGPHKVAPQLPQHDLDYRTHFERRMRKTGEPVYRSLFKRPAD